MLIASGVFIHVLGALLLAASFGALLMHLVRGGDRDFPQRKFLAVLHGISLLALLISGVLVAYHSELFGQSLWIWIKIGIWFVFGMFPAVLYRNLIPVQVAAFLLALLFGFSAYLGIMG